MTDLADELRIIAADRGKLDIADRCKIAELAERYEQAQRTITALSDAHAQAIAALDRYREDAKFRSLINPLKLSMSSGWIKVS